MSVRQIPANTSLFSEIAVGDLFILVEDLGREIRFPIIFRKVEVFHGFNAAAENWEGESCNRGFATINPNMEVIPLQ